MFQTQISPYMAESMDMDVDVDVNTDVKNTLVRLTLVRMQGKN